MQEQNRKQDFMLMSEVNMCRIATDDYLVSGFLMETLTKPKQILLSESHYACFEVLSLY